MKSFEGLIMAVTAAVLPNAAFAVTASEKTRDGAAADDAAADEQKKEKRTAFRSPVNGA